MADHSGGEVIRRGMLPMRQSDAIFVTKVVLHRLRRLFQNLLTGPFRFAKEEGVGFSSILTELRLPLWGDGDRAEQAMQIGKVQNLRMAARALDGVVIPKGGLFSFWRQVGPPLRIRGYVAGRMLREGKGAYEVRDVVRGMDLEVVLLGAELEGAGFWDETRIIRTDAREGVAAVVQPALVEDQPRRLLSALAAGIPVIATTACGLVPQPGLTLVPSDDVDALRDALQEILRINSALTPAALSLRPR